LISPSVPPQNRTVDFAIFGGGLAGLSTAISLLDRGKSVVLLDSKAIGAGASGAIAGMINPATGRRATKAWRVEDSYPAVKELLDRMQETTAGRLYENTGVLRPAQTEKMHRQMREQFEKTDWPKDWVHWLSSEEISQRHPGIHCVKGGLWIPIGLMVRMPDYLTAMHRWINQHPKGRVYIDPTIERTYVNGQWILKSDHLDEPLHPDIVIDAKGYGTVRSRDWDWLPLHPVKGQLGIFESEEPLSFSHSISSLGYMARYDDHTLVVGSTYEHDFADVEPTTEAIPRLREKLTRTLPDIADQFTTKQIWSGVRISTPNHKPILGAHPKHPSLFVYVGLGSKGLLYSKFGADLLSDLILDEQAIPDKFAITRLKQRP
jgi:glycine oxidase